MEDLGLFLDLAVNHDAYGVMSIDTTKDFVLDLEQLDEAGYFKDLDGVYLGDVTTDEKHELTSLIDDGYGIGGEKGYEAIPYVSTTFGTLHTYFKNTDDVLIGMNRSFFNLQPQYIQLCLKSLKQGIEIPLALTYYNAKQFLKIYVFSTKKQSTLFA